MISVVFCGNLQNEFKMNEKETVCFEPAMTVRDVLEKLDIDETQLGLISKDGLFTVPSEELKEGDCIMLYPAVVEG